MLIPIVQSYRTAIAQTSVYAFDRCVDILKKNKGFLVFPHRINLFASHFIVFT